MIAAPIALFVYNRPDHARQTIEALRANQGADRSDLYVFSDSARDNQGVPAVREVREFVRSTNGFRSVTVVEQESNLGLANSIIQGVSRVCGERGRVIVVEDDLVTSRYFLRYMNEALECYAEDERVASIHGYWYPVDRPVPETFFLRGASCWGWATWARGWKLFEPDGRKLLGQLQAQRLTREFDLGGAIPYTRMLKHQIAGRNNSWAIRWHASTFLANRLQLWSGRSLVRNIGFDGSGTHCWDTDAYRVGTATVPVAVGNIAIEPSVTARAALVHYHRSTRPGLAERIRGRLRRLVRR